MAILFTRFLLLIALLLGLHSLVSFGSPLQKQGSRRWAPPGALVVRQSGTRKGEYGTISAAVAALGSGQSARSIFIYPGKYKEQVHITYEGHLTIYGWTTDASSYSSNVVVITAGVTADQAGNNDKSGTLRVHKNDFALYNVDVVNTYGNAANHLQAVALSAFGLRQGYYACRIIGYQDTLFANEGTHFYGNSLISGAVDFIFGQRAAAWFDGCTLTPRGEGSITANGRDSETNPSYFVFNKCSVLSVGASAGTSYLGRPWQSYARVVFQNTFLSGVINKAGWEVWSPSDPRSEHVMFGEYQNTGRGASTSRAIGHQWSSAVQVSQILGPDYARWVDQSYMA